MTDNSWRVEALHRFPELAESIRAVGSPYQLWHELWIEFCAAYDSNRREAVDRIYKYAWWCCEQPSETTADDDLTTCVTVCFFENIPEHAKAQEDMVNWWSLEQVTNMKKVFSYMGGPEGYARILAQYAAQPTVPPEANASRHLRD